jgi:hypothetical protein
MFSLAGLVMVSLLGLFAFFKVDRTKSAVWMAVNVAWLAGFGFLAFSYVNWYFGVGLVVAAVETAVSLVSGVSPFSNFMTYVKGVFKNVFFFPVSVFEQVYGLLKSKV